MQRALVLVAALSLAAPSQGCATLTLVVAPDIPAPVGIGVSLAGDALGGVATSLAYKSMAESETGALPNFWLFYGTIVAFDLVYVLVRANM